MYTEPTIVHWPRRRKLQYSSEQKKLLAAKAGWVECKRSRHNLPWNIYIWPTVHYEARADMRIFHENLKKLSLSQMLPYFAEKFTTWKVIAVFWYFILVFLFFSWEKGGKCYLLSCNPVRKVKKTLVITFFKNMKISFSSQLGQDCNEWNRAIFLHNFHLWRAKVYWKTKN